MFDVTIVGGGFAGSLIATLLSRARYSVAVIDRKAAYPQDFRAEQVVGEQVDHLRDLGLLGDLLTDLTPLDHAVVARAGRMIGRVDAMHYGVHYEELVAHARACLPADVAFEVGQAVDVRTSLDRQSVVLASGRTIDSRLVIMASGLQRALLRDLGFRNRTIRDAHSLTFGFDLTPTQAARPDKRVLAYFGERAGDRIDYLTVFPIGATTRANLFTYHDIRSPWARAFRQRPEDVLRATMPGLARVLGSYRVAEPVKARVIDLYSVVNPVRDGIVLIGDAFQTSCPAAGTGIARLLTEIDCLKEHLPTWMASPGMAAEKIATFYADPRKKAADAKAEYDANYRRALACEPGPTWRLHRMQLHLRQRIGGWFGGPERLTTGIRPIRSTRNHRPAHAGAGAEAAPRPLIGLPTPS